MGHEYLGDWCFDLGRNFLEFAHSLDECTHRRLAIGPGIAGVGIGLCIESILESSNGWRDVSRMKLPVIAITWGLATVWVPGVMSGEGPWEVNLIVRAIAQSTFIAGLTIPFDVRDLQIDQRQ